METRSASPDTPLVLGLDSGFAKSGFALVALEDPLTVVTLGVISTEKSDKKRGVKSSDDNLRRAREVAKVLNGFFGDGRVVAVCTEAVSLPRNAATSFQIGLYYGVLSCLLELDDLPVIQVSPKELKRAVCGNASASKEDVAASLDSRFGRAFGPYLVQHGFPAGVHEHAYDALGAVVASLDTEVIRLARRMIR